MKKAPDKNWLAYAVGFGVALLPGIGAAQITNACAASSTNCIVLSNQTLDIAGSNLLANPGIPSTLFELRAGAKLLNSGVATFSGQGIVVYQNIFSDTSHTARFVNTGTLNMDSTAQYGSSFAASLQISSWFNNNSLNEPVAAGTVHARTGWSTIGPTTGIIDLRSSTVKVDPGAALTISGSALIDGATQFNNSGQLEVDGGLNVTGVARDINFGPGELRVGTKNYTRSTLLAQNVAAGSVTLGHGEMQVTGVLSTPALTMSAPLGWPEFYLNGGTSSIGSLTVEAGTLSFLKTLEIANSHHMYVYGPLVMKGGVIDLVHGNLTMVDHAPTTDPCCTIPGPAPSTSSFVELSMNAGRDHLVGGGGFTINRNVDFSGELPDGTVNNAIIRIAGTTSLHSRFTNNGSVEVADGGVLNLDGDGGYFNGSYTVAKSGSMAFEPASALTSASFEDLSNWNASAGTLTGGSYRINGGTLGLSGPPASFINGADLTLVGTGNISVGGNSVTTVSNSRKLVFDNYTGVVRDVRNAVGGFVEVQTKPLSPQTLDLLENWGSLYVRQGTLEVDTLYPYDSTPGTEHGYDISVSRLVGGTWHVGDGGILRINNNFGPVKILAAKVQLDGPQAKLIDGSTGAAALESLESIESSGALVLTKGANLSLTTDTPLVNRGLIDIGIQSVLEAPKGLEQRDGTLTVNGSFIGPVQLLGGWLKGKGVIEGTAFVESYLGPGKSPGHLTINGDLHLSPTAVLEIEVEGTTPGVDMDLLTVNGLVYLGGTLLVKLGGGLQLADLATVSFLDGASSIYGSFDRVTVEGPGAASYSAALQFGYDPQNGALVGQLAIAPVPEPGQWALLLCGCFVLGWRFRKTRVWERIQG